MTEEQYARLENRLASVEEKLDSVEQKVGIIGHESKEHKECSAKGFWGN